MPDTPTPPAIEVSSGGFVDLYRPDPATLNLEDIARGMAYTCRYGGHVSRYYSVAEHVVLVHDLLRHRGAGSMTLRAALFHDTAEAYLGDVVAPLKWAMRRESIDMDAHYTGGWPPDVASRRSPYDALSDRMDDAIAARFGIDYERVVKADVGLTDMWALRIEAAALTRTGGAEWRWPGELPEGGRLPTRVGWVGGMAPYLAEESWIEAVNRLEDQR